jgi:hypothetical protein
MSVIGSNILAGASGQGGYFLTNSLRFRSSASAYLNRTFPVAGNRKTWTWSGWVKRGSLGGDNSIFTGYGNGTQTAGIYFSNDTLTDALEVRFSYSGSWTGFLVTAQVFRDPAAWYHIVFAADTTQATSTERLKLYVNGVQVTAFNSTAYPSQNTDGFINQAQAHEIGRLVTNNGYLMDGYMTECNFIDGQALTPSSFGETSTSTGVWIPKKYTGTYGTNGFYLDFEDTSSTAALGYDAAGSNDWTVNNISLTAGTTYDSMTDVPTLTSATAANYCTLNPLNLYTGTSCANGNLQGTTVTGDECGIYGTIGMTSGKFYWESTPSSISSGGCMIGIAPAATQGSSGSPGLTVTTGYGYYTTGSKYAGSGGVAYGNTFTTSDVIGCALDLDNGKIWWSKDGVFQASGDPAAGTNAAFTSVSGTFVPGIGNGGAGSFSTVNVNFGQQPFEYTPPAGFVALNTFNLPTPTIGATAATTANKYMNIALYTGTGSSQSITGLGFQPDWTWIKERNAAADHGLYDAVRGVQKQLESNTTTAETTETTGLTAFGSDGFTVGALAQLNTSADTYVAWNWKANGAGVSNTAGSITSTVSANTSAGFSIVTFTAPSSGQFTVGHGLGVTPNMVIVKNRTTGSTSWFVYHSSLGVNNTDYLVLNTTAAEASFSTMWGASGMTSSTCGFTVAGSTYANDNHVAYCFAQVAGYSAFGSYTGNGSTDGPFIFTGFRPRYVMTRRSDAIESWRIGDSARSPYNAVELELFANLSNAEENNSNPIDYLSNGFKILTSSSSHNASGGTYIYMVFAENPFKYANAR